MVKKVAKENFKIKKSSYFVVVICVLRVELDFQSVHKLTGRLKRYELDKSPLENM